MAISLKKSVSLSCVLLTISFIQELRAEELKKEVNLSTEIIVDKKASKLQQDKLKIIEAKESGLIPQSFLIQQDLGVLTKEKSQLEQQNIINTEDIFNNINGLQIRKRFTGDRNALLTGRTFNNLQPQRGLVFADGFQISNFLGRFNAPRWHMVNPEELTQVSILQGPFSAQYGGNSIGATIEMLTNPPTEDMTTLKIQGFSQHYKEYGTNANYLGQQQNFYTSKRFDDVALSFTANHFKGNNQPQAFATFNPSTNTNLTGTTAVSGAYFDQGPTNNNRVILGDTGSEKSEQTQTKLRLWWLGNTNWKSDAIISWWGNHATRENNSYLKDASGNKLTQGNVAINGRRYNVSSTFFTPQATQEQHQLLGAHTQGTTDFGIFDVRTMFYKVLQDRTETYKTAVLGQSNRLDGTNWQQHQLQWQDLNKKWNIGLQQDKYELNLIAVENPSYRNNIIQAVDQLNQGKTTTNALFAQYHYKNINNTNNTNNANNINAIIGLRYEDWSASGSQNFRGINNANQPQYQAKNHQAFSPKLVVYSDLENQARLRFSLGRAVRFPTVSELYQGTRVGNSIVQNDPNLRPETNFAKEISYEQSGLLNQIIINQIGQYQYKLSAFHEQFHNAIWSQTNINQGITTSFIQNIDKIKVQGLQSQMNLSQLPYGFGVDFGVLLRNSKVQQNQAVSSSESKRFVRLPNVQINLGINQQRKGHEWGINTRITGRQYGELDNSDTNDKTFGAVSRSIVSDIYYRYNVTKNNQLQLGIDNLFNRCYYAFHPFPQRTVSLSLRMRLD